MKIFIVNKTIYLNNYYLPLMGEFTVHNYYLPLKNLKSIIENY